MTMAFQPGEEALENIGAPEPKRVTIVGPSDVKLASPKSVDPASGQPQSFPAPEETFLVRDESGDVYPVPVSKLQRLT